MTHQMIITYYYTFQSPNLANERATTSIAGGLDHQLGWVKKNVTC